MAQQQKLCWQHCSHLCAARPPVKVFAETGRAGGTLYVSYLLACLCRLHTMGWDKCHCQEAALARMPMQHICKHWQRWLTVAPNLCLQIAHHVLGQHRYRQPGDDGLSTMTDAQDR